MTGRLRVLLVPDSIYWVTGTIAKSIATANPWIDATIVSGPLLGDMFVSADEIADRFDLVHFICPYASRDWLPALASKVPVVTSHHHVTSWDLIGHNVDGDAIVAGSQEWVHDLELRGADMERVFRVPYGVDVDLFRPATPAQKKAMRDRLGLSNAAPVIGFFAKGSSNDDDRKGTDVFARAVVVLHGQLPDAGVLIVGPGWHDLVANFRDAGIPCAWLPFVEDAKDVPPLYHALDFYWVTARVEGGPVPLLEAMSSEVCCLTTAVGLAREVVRDGVNAALLPMNDAGAFASKTVELWSDDSRRQAMGYAARETMQNEMRADEMARLVEPVYKKANENFARRNPKAASRSSRTGLTSAEQKKAAMLEALAWSENLVLYQNQRVAALRLILKAWADNPGSIEPPPGFPEALPSRAGEESPGQSQADATRVTRMISVIVCTHNPRVAYLSRALAALEEQTLPRAEWELVIIDNASDERLETRLELSWHPRAKIIREDELGLTPARLRGIRESSGDVLVFVDDDNILANDYLATVRDIALNQPHLGAWSGSVAPEFDAPPPEWTRRYWGNLVIRDVTRDNWSNVHSLDETTPLGAGLCVRRMAAAEYLRLHDERLRTRRLDRAGRSLVSGGDNDLAACAIDVGLACGVLSSLHLTHIIPKERLTEDYLLRLIEGVAYSSVILRSFRPETRNGVSRKSALGRAADLLRKARMNSRERRFAAAVERGQSRALKELESA